MSGRLVPEPWWSCGLSVAANRIASMATDVVGPRVTADPVASWDSHGEERRSHTPARKFISRRRAASNTPRSAPCSPPIGAQTGGTAGTWRPRAYLGGRPGVH